MCARILLVEDTPHNIELMEYLLEARGHVILKAFDGTTAVDAAERERPDLIVLDLQLPDMDGFEVLRRIQSSPKLAGIPTCAVTAYAMVGDRERVLSSGFDAYLTKPLEPRRFTDELERLLPSSMHSAEAPAHNIAPVPEPVRGVGTRGLILVVDDTTANLRLARGILEPSGYEVLTATSVESALHLVENARPDAVVCDIHMPGADGFALYRTLAERSLNVPFIFLSATGDTRDAARAAEVGARVIIRPIEPEALLRVVEELTSTSPSEGA